MVNTHELQTSTMNRQQNNQIIRQQQQQHGVNQDEPNMSIFMSMFVTMLQFVNVVLHFSFQSVFV